MMQVSSMWQGGDISAIQSTGMEPVSAAAEV
jgi:hypothetical protein